MGSGLIEVPVGEQGQVLLANESSGATPVVIDVVGYISAVTSISAGADHACAVTSGQGVDCWGGNEYGQLGDGTTTGRPTPVQVQGLRGPAVAVSAGLDETCALLQTRNSLHGGVVQCWGLNSLGQLGNDTIGGSSPVPELVGGLSGVVSISVGADHACALLYTATVKCWGADSDGEDGDGGGFGTNRATPVPVTGLTGVNSVSAGDDYTCAVRVAVAVKCWGDGVSGQLGDGTFRSSGFPVSTVPTEQALSVAAGGGQTCTVTDTGGVDCWGRDDQGQLGTAAGPNQRFPRGVNRLGVVDSVSTGAADTCVVNSAPAVQCWGYNADGELGYPATYHPSAGAPRPETAYGATAVTAGYDSTCALLLGGSVQCWGANGSGQLGDGTTMPAIFGGPVTGL